MLTSPMPERPPATAPSSGSRHCPSCNAASSIQGDQALWPAGWTCSTCGTSLPIAHGFRLLAPDLDDTNDGFDLENFRFLADVEAGNFWFIGRNELIGWLISRFASRARRVLEIGCGTGFALSAARNALPGARIAGSELHSRGLLTARERHGEAVELFQMDARDARLTGVLDLVGAYDVLEHIADDRKVLGEVARMLKPGGILIATVPQHPWMWSTADDLALHQRRYRIGELAAKAHAAGLQPLYATSFVTLAFPLMMAARLLERLRPRKLSLTEFSEQQYRTSRSVNAALLGLCRVEHWLRRAGIPLPIGGSQVLVAQRTAPSDTMATS